MSSVSLVTKGMICQGSTGCGGVFTQQQQPVVEMPIINVIKVKTKIPKILSNQVDLSELSRIVFNVDKVLSTY